jgi:hypothetical protein
MCGMRGHLGWTAFRMVHTWMNKEWAGNLQSDYIVVIIGLLGPPCSTEVWY